MKPSKDKINEYFVLTIRFLLALVFLNYGIAKLVGGQFGISAKDAMLPVKDLGLFKLFWYLMDQNPFKVFIGVFQIITAVFILINRAMLIGLFLFLVIVVNILIMDITYLKMPGFYDILTWYILLDIYVLYYYRVRFINAWTILTAKFVFVNKYSWWVYLTLPLAAILLGGILIFVPRVLYLLITNPHELSVDLNLMVNDVKLAVSKVRN